MPASMQASVTTAIVGRAPLDRIVETTDLMELRNLLISLGSFQKCEPARTWVVVVIEETRPVSTIRFSTRFSSLRKKNFLFAHVARPAARRASFNICGLFAHIFRKRNMSQN
jgi:hypothetical protein